MFLAVLSNYLILISLFGYSLIFKNFFCNKKKKIKIVNIDFFYGFLFLIFLSLLLNFFFPLKYFTIPTIVIGITIFIYGIKKRYYKINFIYYFLIIFIITFISFYSSDNVDSPLYHLQIIKWINLYKINFGIANLEVRFGFNSTWHLFIGLLNITYEKFSSKYYLSAIIFGVILYEVFQNKKKYKYSDIFLYLIICYLFIFSYLHPYNYGVILNHLGNPERDIVSMLLYFFTFYFFIKIFENSNTTEDKDNLINLFFICSFICVTTREATIPIAILFFYFFYKNENYKIINRGNIFIGFVGFLWILRSFILSGCFVFPIIQSCFKTNWAADTETIQFLVKEAMRYSRTLPSLNKVSDLNFTLYTYDWLVPWLKNYFLEAALLQIDSILIIFVITLLILKFIFKNKMKLFHIKIEQYEFIIFFTLILNIFFWMQAPEIRYAWGLLIVLPCFFILIYIKNSFFNKIVNFNHKFFLGIFLIIFLLFSSKSLHFFKVDDLLSIRFRQHDFSKIQKVGTFDNVDIYYNFWQCADYEFVCVNIPKKQYKITQKYSYTFFENNFSTK
jgi:hypothetical protein